MYEVCYLGQVAERLDDISLDRELECDQLLGQFVLCVSTELQHLPARSQLRVRTTYNSITEATANSRLQQLI